MHRRLVNPRLRFDREPIEADPTANGGASTGGLTQEQVDAIVQARVAAAQRKAKEDAEAALKAKLGDQSLDAVLAAAKAAKDAEDAKKSEADRALEAANVAKAEAERIQAEAKTELHRSRVTAALVAAGVPEAGLAAITVPGVTVESTPEEIKAAVDGLKKTLPGLFGTAGGTSADPGTPGGAPRPVAGAGAAGAAEFERRFGKTA